MYVKKEKKLWPTANSISSSSSATNARRKSSHIQQSAAVDDNHIQTLPLKVMQCSLSLTHQALAGLVEIPAIGIAMYIIMRTGKKWLFSTAFLATGLSCLIAAFCENESRLWLKITFVMIGERTNRTKTELFC